MNLFLVEYVDENDILQNKIVYAKTITEAENSVIQNQK